MVARDRPVVLTLMVARDRPVVLTFMVARDRPVVLTLIQYNTIQYNTFIQY